MHEGRSDGSCTSVLNECLMNDRAEWVCRRTATVSVRMLPYCDVCLGLGWAGLGWAGLLASFFFLVSWNIFSASFVQVAFLSGLWREHFRFVDRLNVWGGGGASLIFQHSLSLLFIRFCVCWYPWSGSKPSTFMIIISSSHSRPRYPSGRWAASRSSNVIWGHANAVQALLRRPSRCIWFTIRYCVFNGGPLK